jgi:hypothetical protein
MQGIELDEEQFTSMKSSQQMLVLFKNTQAIYSAVKTYRLHQKFQYAAITFLVGAAVFILTKISDKAIS